MSVDTARTSACATNRDEHQTEPRPQEAGLTRSNPA
jgi:hypothetical protein